MQHIKQNIHGIKNKYKITFYDEDNTTKLGESQVEYGTPATAPTVESKQDTDGYELKFEKWVDELGVEQDISNVTANKNVYAKYKRTPIEYKITYENTQGATNTNKTTYTVEDADITLQPLSSKKGMTFEGWYTDNTYTTPITSIITSKKENITVYAKWNIEQLYLRSTQYKIVGQNENIHEYEEGDEYLYRVSAQTTLSEFRDNCQTNGTITVYKQDGTTLLGDDELVGTGMILKDTLNDQEITLQIAVTGDADGNGKITTADLTVLRGDLYENNKIEGIYLKAMDIDEK